MSEHHKRFTPTEILRQALDQSDKEHRELAKDLIDELSQLKITLKEEHDQAMRIVDQMKSRIANVLLPQQAEEQREQDGQEPFRAGLNI